MIMYLTLLCVHLFPINLLVQILYLIKTQLLHTANIVLVVKCVNNLSRILFLSHLDLLNLFAVMYRALLLSFLLMITNSIWYLLMTLLNSLGFTCSNSNLMSLIFLSISKPQ